MHRIALFALLCTQLCGCGGQESGAPHYLRRQIDSLKAQYAPDTRTVLWHIALKKDEKGPYIKGVWIRIFLLRCSGAVQQCSFAVEVFLYSK